MTTAHHRRMRHRAYVRMLDLSLGVQRYPLDRETQTTTRTTETRDLAA